MSNKFTKKLDLPAGAAPEEQDSTFLSADPIETLVAGADKIAGAIPGGQWLKDKATMALGVPGEFVASERARLQSEHPVASAVGTAGELATGAITLPFGAAADAGRAAKAAISAGQAALLAPAYKLGDTADQAALMSSPLRTEQITHSLFTGDSVTAALLAAILHAPGAILEYASPYIREFAAGQASKSAGKLFPKAAERLGLTADEVGRLALDKNLLLRTGEVSAQLRAAGKTMGEVANKTEVDQVLRNKLGEELQTFAQTLEPNTGYDAARTDLLKQAKAFQDHELSGGQIEKIIQGFNGRAARATKAIYRDAAQKLRAVFSEHLNIMHPENGAAYDAAVSDYATLNKLKGEAVKGASKQAQPVTQALQSLIRGATRDVAVGVLGGPVAGAAFAAVDMGRGAVRGNYAQFFDNFAKNPPNANFMVKSGKALQSLLSPATVANSVVSLSQEEVDKRYELTKHTLRQAAIGPDLAGQHLRGQLDFLPPHEADAVVANTVSRLQDAALALPDGPHPPTAFGIQTGPTDREKRVFLEKFDASFDPYKAIASGRADLIAEAEKHNPEVMHYLKTQLIAKLSERQDIPYEQKRKLSALLGVAGVPLQDPALGAQLQQVIQTRREADSQAGQMHSARQHAASQKQNKASLTRAQKLLEE